MQETDVKEEGTEETPETTTEESSTTEQTVPYSRFKDVNDDKKELETEVKTLKESQPDKLTPEEQKNKLAEEYLSGLVKKEIDKQTETDTQTEKAEQKEFDEQVNEVLDANTDIKRPDFLKFIEDNDKEFEFSSVNSALKVYKALNTTAKDAKAEGKEDILNKPELPSSEAGNVESTEPPTEDANRTLGQVVQDIVKGMTKKSE